MRKVNFFIMDEVGFPSCSTQAAITTLLVAKKVCALAEAKEIVKKVKTEALEYNASFYYVSPEWSFYAEKNPLTKAHS